MSTTKKKTKSYKTPVPSNITKEPEPSTSGLNEKGSPFDVISEESKSDFEVDTDVCCVYGHWQPEVIRGCDIIIFVT